ncbi:MAG: protein kinase, partial [Anaerolineales bacterium]|nr:protein kinase [Anaerolineales bacterium]
EAQLIARLEHLHIVPLYDFWRDPTGAYLVMRWMRGGSLARALEPGPFDLPAAVRMLDQVASGLAAAHNHRIVHRDVKPSNILFDEDGNAYLSDFGVAKDLAVPGGVAAAREGFTATLDYISPEQARGEEITPRTDIYSLGVTLYETLTAEHPFPGLTSVDRLYKHLNEPIPPLNSISAELRDAVNDVVQKATAKDPKERYGGALEMAAAFRAAAQLGDEGDTFRQEETLTPRENEILLQIVAGRTNKQIARELFVEVPTVKWHITQLYRKLGVRSRMQAVARARQLDLVGVDGDEQRSETGRPGSISVSLSEPVNPYKGLRPYEAADSRDFFGREPVVEKLLERLNENDPLARFLAVVGPSGSGKSSLLGAGLVPAIWGGRLPGSERWFVVELTPGARPIDELEVALTRIAADQAVNLHEHLNRDEAGLVRAAGLILPNDGSDLCLVIDQFEELFTLTEDADLRRKYLDLLITAVRDPASRIRIVLALRADFYDRPLEFPEFGALLESRMETLLPLSAADLERVILQPAGQVGMTFEPGLASQIIQEMLYQPGALPLLQYALTELFDRRDGRLLTRKAYDDIGGA